jgi:hypothetical protein
MVLEYKIGDWYILTDKEIDEIYRISRKKRNEVFYLIGQILTIKNDSIIIKFKEFEQEKSLSYLENYYRLATEDEIKKEKIKLIFINKKTIKDE